MKDGCTPKNKAKDRSLPVLPAKAAKEGGIAHSRMGKVRAGALIGLHLLMIAHIVQWQLMGTTVSPIEPSESMFTLQNGAVNAGVIFFSLAIIATLIFGRFVCGWACHVVALQDLCGWMMKKIGITPKPFRSRLLIFVPLIAALYMFVWPTVSKALTKPESEPLFGPFTNHLTTTEFWATFPSIAVAIPFLFICGFLTVYFLGAKGFCTYGCPYGGFFAIADKFAAGRIRVTDACNECGHCTATCTSNVLVHAEVKKYGMVVDQGCMKCMDCVSVCPNDALYFGFGKPSVGVKKDLPKKYSLTWPEELFAASVFVLSYFAVWNVYQLVPMLMAIGVAAVSSFLAVKAFQAVWRDNSAFNRWALTSAGKLQRAGWVFVLGAGLWLGLVAHSGWVRYHESAGTRAYENVNIPDELALAQADPRVWLSAADRSNVADSRRHFEAAAKLGIFENTDAMPKLAWMQFLFGDAGSAVDTLDEAAASQTDTARALSLYYRGALLNRLGRPGEAQSSLTAALEERPDLTAALEERGAAYWKLGDRERAIDDWKSAASGSTTRPIAMAFLIGGFDQAGDAARANALRKELDKSMPNDARFKWMLGRRLENVGMRAEADRYFAAAYEMEPALRRLSAVPQNLR